MRLSHRELDTKFTHIIYENAWKLAHQSIKAGACAKQKVMEVLAKVQKGEERIARKILRRNHPELVPWTTELRCTCCKRYSEEGT